MFNYCPCNIYKNDYSVSNNETISAFAETTRPGESQDGYSREFYIPFDQRIKLSLIGQGQNAAFLLRDGNLIWSSATDNFGYTNTEQQINVTPGMYQVQVVCFDNNDVCNANAVVTYKNVE